MCLCLCLDIYIHTYTNAHTHTYMYTSGLAYQDYSNLPPIWLNGVEDRDLQKLLYLLVGVNCDLLWKTDVTVS